MRLLPMLAALALFPGSTGCTVADDYDPADDTDDDTDDGADDDDTGGQPDDDDAADSWAYPTIATGSKIGVHGIYSTNILEYAQALVDGGAHFPVVKAVDDLWWLGEIKAISPQTITIARLTHPWEACQDVEGADHDAMADLIMGEIQAKLAAEPELWETADYWEVINEPDPPGAGGYAALAQLMIECIERADAMGIKIAIFSLNAGTPEYDEMVAMVETGVFGHAKAGGHIYAIHEGVFGNDTPIDQWWGDTIPGSPVVDGAGALCFRYRYVYDLLEQRDEVVPLFVSEFYAGGGYSGDDPEVQDIADRMIWYDAQAAEDYYMWAFMPFTLGPCPGWENQDYSFVYPSLVEHMVAIKDRVNGDPP